MHVPYLPEKGRGKEKYYFMQGNLGFPMFNTPFGLRIGTLICYDRNFPEAARVLGLAGVSIVFVPTCTYQFSYGIDKNMQFSKEMWEIELRVMARTNGFYACGVNRVGIDADGCQERLHFGDSVIINPKGEIISQAGDREEVVYADIDLRTPEEERAFHQIYRDRRPDAYGPLVER